MVRCLARDVWLHLLGTGGEQTWTGTSGAGLVLRGDGTVDGCRCLAYVERRGVDWIVVVCVDGEDDDIVLVSCVVVMDGDRCEAFFLFSFCCSVGEPRERGGVASCLGFSLLRFIYRFIYGCEIA